MGEILKGLGVPVSQQIFLLEFFLFETRIPLSFSKFCRFIVSTDFENSPNQATLRLIGVGQSSFAVYFSCMLSASYPSGLETLRRRWWILSLV